MLVDIDFVEAGVGVGFRNLDDFGGNSLARAAPCCKGINHAEARLLEGILVLLSAAEELVGPLARSGMKGEWTETKRAKPKGSQRKVVIMAVEKTYEVMLWTPILKFAC